MTWYFDFLNLTKLPFVTHLLKEESAEKAGEGKDPWEDRENPCTVSQLVVFVDFPHPNNGTIFL